VGLGRVEARVGHRFIRDSTRQAVGYPVMPARNEATRWLACLSLLFFAMSYSPVVRGSAWRIAICMSRIGTPLTSPAVQKVRRNPCGVMCLHPVLAQ
jgi:hypothetical protein